MKPRTPLARFLVKDGDNALGHRVMRFLVQEFVFEVWRQQDDE